MYKHVQNVAMIVTVARLFENCSKTNSEKKNIHIHNGKLNEKQIRKTVPIVMMRTTCVSLKANNHKLKSMKQSKNPNSSANTK